MAVFPKITLAVCRGRELSPRNGLAVTASGPVYAIYASGSRKQQQVSDRNSNLRIDEILLSKGLVSEDQVKEALEYQRQHGGRLGSLLVRLGHVDERGLVTALADQFDCQPVVISEEVIAPDVIAMIPADVAVARAVIPFAFDSATNTLKVACDTPSDEALADELKFVSSGRNIELYVAAEMPLREAIARHHAAAAGDQVNGALAALDDSNGNADIAAADPCQGRVLLVSDDGQSDQPLRQALEQEGYEVVATESADDAIEIIGRQSFGCVFLRDTVQGDYIDLIDRLRKVSPRTVVRYFESTAQLLLDQRDQQSAGDLLVRNLQLFTALLATKDDLAENHAGIVGHYAQKLCAYIGLPARETQAVSAAAYLHDLSRFYYGESKEAPDCRARVKLTVKLLDSLNYPPLVLGVLNSMYGDLRQRFTQRLPIEVLGGNILTIVDIFCEHLPIDQRMSLDRFESIKQKIDAMTGKLFLAEVVDAFVMMIKKELLIEPRSEGHNQVLMYSSDLDYLQSIAGRLREEGFRPVALDSRDKFVEMYERSRPDMIILLEDGKPSRSISLIDNLVKRGVTIMQIPTFLLTSQKAASALTQLFEQGLEDIIPIENSLDLLVMKMYKVRERIETRRQPAAADSDGEPDSGITAGKLEDMNLIDLLQAMGPSRKTARIRVSSQGSQLTLCLNKGQIIFAESECKTGAEAVYDGVSWTSGKWVIQPLSENELPAPNNEEPNESILMEGCRRLDEQTRATT